MLESFYKECKKLKESKGAMFNSYSGVVVNKKKAWNAIMKENTMKTPVPYVLALYLAGHFDDEDLAIFFEQRQYLLKKKMRFTL